MNKKIAWLIVTVSILIGGVAYTHYTDAQTAAQVTAKPATTQTAQPVQTTAPKKTAVKKATAAKTEVTVTYQKHETVTDPSTKEVYTRSYPLQENTITIDESTPSAVDPIVKDALEKQGYTYSGQQDSPIQNNTTIQPYTVK